MVNHYLLDNLLDKIKETIGILKFDTDDKLPDHITLKNVVILTT